MRLGTLQIKKDRAAALWVKDYLQSCGSIYIAWINECLRKFSL